MDRARAVLELALLGRDTASQVLIRRAYDFLGEVLRDLEVVECSLDQAIATGASTLAGYLLLAAAMMGSARVVPLAEAQVKLVANDAGKEHDLRCAVLAICVAAPGDAGEVVPRITETLRTGRFADCECG